MELTFVYILCWVFMLLVVGYQFQSYSHRTLRRLGGWAIVMGTTLFSIIISKGMSPLTRMSIIVALQLVSMKVLVAAETHPKRKILTPIQWTAFCLAWFGMRPALFENLPSTALSFSGLLIKGISRVVVGVVFLYCSAVLDQNSALDKFFIAELFLLIGLSLILHFGILNIYTAGWRMFGVNVQELFRSPFKAKSLREFWGQRWNIAFSEMTALVAYRPLKSVGVRQALALSFLLSGLLHEIAISFPPMTGFGLPLAYFGIHAFAMQLEAHTRFLQKLNAHRFLSHVWVVALLVLPSPLLFHREFIQQVLVPLRTIILQMFVFVNN